MPIVQDFDLISHLALLLSGGDDQSARRALRRELTEFASRTREISPPTISKWLQGAKPQRVRALAFLSRFVDQYVERKTPGHDNEQILSAIRRYFAEQGLHERLPAAEPPSLPFRLPSE